MRKLAMLAAGVLVFAACGDSQPPEPVTKETVRDEAPAGKAVVYQVFTRLYGNTSTTNTSWGTIEENGVGKFEDFTDAALASIRDLGTTHIWYTGIPHHGVIRDYSEFGISADDPDVIKGRAGSPYAVKDYYTVNPDLATDPARRLEEFEALIARTHAHGMKVLIDIVPNHVARGYESLAKPDGVVDFGANDDTTVEYARDNNFYYVVGQDFEVPESPEGYAPLGGDDHPLSDGRFNESPAKWTGNGARAARPDFNDWFETVKVNYGVRPDGSFDFERLPDEARGWDTEQHAEFWSDKDVPDSWNKFLHIVLYWTDKGVDGFRYDMAEMVPVEFWSYLNSGIKAKNPDAFLLAEVYNPALYRDYLQLGRMDYLYDKVGFYDTLKPIMQGTGSTDDLAPIHAEVLDIEEHMLHFLENHDEQRIASPGFAGDALKGKPAMVVSALISRSPTMLYFAQDVGEPGDGDAGFGDPTRTTIFDYWGVPTHQRYMNGGAFDGGQSTPDERQLRDFYERLMRFSASSAALRGEYADIHDANRAAAAGYDDTLFSFVRWRDDDRLIVVSSFDDNESKTVTMTLPADIVTSFGLNNGRYTLEEQLYGVADSQLIVDAGLGRFEVTLGPLESMVFRVGRQDIVRYDTVESQFGILPRHVDVWLPAGYDDDNEAYSVLYMHDGQNLFNADMSYGGVEWGIDETLQRLIDEGRVKKTIVVGAWNTSERSRDYMPMFAWDAIPAGQRSDLEQSISGRPLSEAYYRFLTEELKPMIDDGFRVKTGREDTFLMGSSRGGLISLDGLIRHGETFSAAACVSMHWTGIFHPADAELQQRTADALSVALPDPERFRIYFDHGTTELDAGYGRFQLRVDEIMRRGGYSERNWITHVFEGTGHHERDWQARADIPLTFLLGDNT
ncbi:MAG: alpha/beta hydrolase-fold protein [Pseudomonadota bacterium]